MSVATKLTGIQRGAAFAPTDIAGLQLWQDYSDATKLYTDAGTTLVSADGDAIYQANDKSGNARHMSQSSAALRPLYKTNIQNGKAVARFDAGQIGEGYLQSPAIAAGLAQPLTEFLAVNQRVWGGGSRFLDGSTTDSLVLIQLTATPTIKVYAGTAFVADNTALAVGTFGIVSIVWNGASSKIRVNGGAGTTGDPGAGGLTAGDGRRLGAKYTGTVSTNAIADVGTHLLYNTALSNANHDLVGNLLATQWGLTWTAVS